MILAASKDVYSGRVRYDGIGQDNCNPVTNEGCCDPADPSSCKGTIKVEITQDIARDETLFFYYELSDFYQTHTTYANSRSDDQIRAVSYDSGDCDPLSTWGTEDKVLYPCGLQASGAMNDTFFARLCPADGSACYNLTDANDPYYPSWSSYDVAWTTDYQEKFIRRDPLDSETVVGPSGALPMMDDQAFMNWMRVAGIPGFKKLYRKIDGVGFSKGDVIELDILNVFPSASSTDRSKSTKSVVLSTTSYMGGKNAFLGWVYVIFALSLFVCGIVLLIAKLLLPHDHERYFHPAPAPVSHRHRRW